LATTDERFRADQLLLSLEPAIAEAIQFPRVPDVPLDADWDECVVCGYRTDPE